MFEIKNHHIANKIVKSIKDHFISFKKIIKRLQLIVFKCKEKMSRSIQAIIVYILNDFKRGHSKLYSNFSASTRDDLRAANLMINDMKLIKNSQTNVFSNNDFIQNFSITISRVDIIKTDTLISSTKVVVFKFAISKIVSTTSRKASQSENIDYFNKLNIVSSAANFVSF